MQTYNVIACGLDISFSSDADAERVKRATELIQQSYDSLRSHGSQLGRDRLLTILAIGIADDLLQLQNECDRLIEASENKESERKAINQRLGSLLHRLETSLSENSIGKQEENID